MKKFFYFALAFTFALGLVGCDNDTTTEATTVTTTEATVENNAPVFNDVVDLEFQQGEEFSIGSITASDTEDGDLTDDIVVDDSELDIDSLGEYTVTLSVTDSDGETTSVVVNVTVVSNPAVLAQEALDAIELVYVDGQEEIDLPRFNSNGTVLYWATDNSHVITTGGFILPPHVGSDPVEVTLTCTANNSGTLLTKDFVVTVQPYEESTVTQRTTLPFIGTSEEYVVEDIAEVDVFYVDDGTVPYMDVETFLDMIEGAIESSEISYTPIGDDQLQLQYTVEWLDFDEVTLISETYTAIIDFTENTLTV
ncbi:MAG: DUF5011 domain-containing protein, partial [Sphaerochaetaceae bacterium]|nr:DUF5011 domain-containing protein [Sphaerochaetaceae bacterium]